VQSLFAWAPGARSIPVGRSAAAVLVMLSLVLAACGSDATPSPDASATPAQSGGDSVAAEALARTIPTQVGDVALAPVSGTLADLRGDLPSYDELVLRLQNASVEPSGVIGAVGRPTDGGTDPTVGAILVVDAPPGGLGLLGLMQAWTASIPGATAENTNVGQPVVKVTFEDGSPTLYYYAFDTNLGDEEESDTLYFVRTADEALAEAALTQLP